LMDRGMTYELPDGVYFSVQAYNEELGTVTKYGKLAPSATAAERIEITSPPQLPSSGDMGSQKKDSRDFVLWKRKKTLEAIAWPSPWGDGRPGWHIECSAMIEAVQSQFRHTHQFMVHAGGIDLKFPHHTNEIAQSEAYRGTGEWIAHWVHMGHLHIDGLKMSKSLKNFVSIQDFLGEYTTGSALESPGDDFRIWCLGLSGSYRGPATFCRKRLDEARAVRQQILRFLLTAQSWVEEGTLDSTTKVWQKEDVDLYTTCHESRIAGMSALRNDMDGAEYLKGCLRIVTAGNLYMSNRGRQTSPVEPMNIALSTLCKMLELVGVSERTTRAGIRNQDKSSVGSNQVVGGEGSLINQLVNFRSSVRRAALEDVKSGRGTENTALILEMSDRLRNENLPSIGIELLDEKAENVNDSWRFCIPRVKELGQTDDSSSEISNDESIMDGAADVPPEDFFRVGRYEGLFSKFNAEGIPTHNADGSEVSVRATKKLLKKREARQAKKGG
jgi:cysteinyl-tRNA synthetase